MHLTNTDYWLQLGKDICFGLYFRNAEFPAPTDLPMLPQNILYYCGPRIPSQVKYSVQNVDAVYCQTLHSTIIGSDGTGLTHLSHISIWFGELIAVTPATAHIFNNHDIPCFAQQVL